jgi:hypothetical protein
MQGEGSRYYIVQEQLPPFQPGGEEAKGWPVRGTEGTERVFRAG